MFFWCCLLKDGNGGGGNFRKKTFWLKRVNECGRKFGGAQNIYKKAKSILWNTAKNKKGEIEKKLSLRSERRRKNCLRKEHNAN